MKKLAILFVLICPIVKASGITGSSGNELLYVYGLFVGMLLIFLLFDSLIKLGIRKYKAYRFHKQHPELQDIN